MAETRICQNMLVVVVKCVSPLPSPLIIYAVIAAIMSPVFATNFSPFFFLFFFLSRAIQISSPMNPASKSEYYVSKRDETRFHPSIYRDWYPLNLLLRR